MPATFSHPAAILPLRRLAPRWLNLTGLVLGSMAPDFGYFLLLFDGAKLAHTPAGLLLVALPSSLIAWGLLQLSWPTMSLILPPRHRAFLTGLVVYRGAIQTSLLVKLSASMLLGAATHLIWDSFTHKQSWFVATYPALRTPIPIAGGFEAPGYYLLQHISSLLGAVALVTAYRSAMRRQPELPAAKAGDGRPLATVLVLAVLIGCAAALPVAAHFEGSRCVRTFAFRSVVHAMALTTAFAFAWGWLKRRRERPKRES